jgi:hypothetical protein
MWLLLVALFGLLVPNGIFVYWLLTEFDGVGGVIANRLALAFIIEAFLVLGIIAYYFARNPIGTVPWYWFVVLSLIGGLGFGVPFYYWLNKQESSNASVR